MFFFCYGFVFCVFVGVVCFLFVTRPSGCLVCILWLCFLSVVLFWIFVFHFSQKRPKNGHSKNPQKSKMQKKETILFSVSAVVFTDSVPFFSGWAKMHVLLKTLKNCGAKIGFLNFLCFDWDDFFDFAKTLWKQGFQIIFVFLWLKERKKDKNKITGISGFEFFGSENGRFVTHNCFSKICSLKPCFYSVLGVRTFLARLSKREILDTHQTRRIWLITEKLFFWDFCIFLCFFLFVSFFGCFFGPPHLALKTPNKNLFCFVFFAFLCF